MVEFLLVMPFIIILFGILTEYVYALTINMNLNQGLKSVTSLIYGQINPGVDKEQVRDNFVKYWLRNYLRSRYAPANSENELNVDYRIVGEDAVFIASYKYIPSFTLPNIYFHFLPNSMRFSAISVIPSVLLKENIYDGSTTENIYDGSTTNIVLWGAPVQEANKHGVMELTGNTTGAIVDSIIFLIPKAIAGVPLTDKTYEVKKWNGENYRYLSTSNLAVNLTDKKPYSCNSDFSSCSEISGIPNFISYFPNTVTNIFFYDDYSDALPWVEHPNASISSILNSGNLKNALALVENNTYKSVGNYDDLDILGYNTSLLPSPPVNNHIFSDSGKYVVETYGSLVIVHNGNQTKAELNSILNNLPVPSYSATDFSSEFGVLE